MRRDKGNRKTNEKCRARKMMRVIPARLEVGSEPAGVLISSQLDPGGDCSLSLHGVFQTVDDTENHVRRGRMVLCDEDYNSSHSIAGKLFGNYTCLQGGSGPPGTVCP
jgi:hypothetical protein